MKKTPKMKTKHKSVSINITLSYTLHSWSDSLTYDELNDTLFLLGIYLDDTNQDAINSKDKKLIEHWLTTNDIEKFISSRDAATKAYATMLENEMYAKDVIGMKYHHPRSH